MVLEDQGLGFERSDVCQGVLADALVRPMFVNEGCELLKLAAVQAVQVDHVGGEQGQQDAGEHHRDE